MTIGIDVSQTAYKNTGVANYLTKVVEKMIESDEKNEYVFFYSSLRNRFDLSDFKFSKKPKNLTVKTFKFPAKVLDLLWNKFHVVPIEWFIGPVDIFVTSDWTEPPAKKARKATFLYDLIVYKYPNETAAGIVATQKRKLSWVVKEASAVFCISEATKKDAQEILRLSPEKLHVIYPGA